MSGKSRERWEAVIFSEDLIQLFHLFQCAWLFVRWDAASVPRKVLAWTPLPSGGWLMASFWGAITGEGFGLTRIRPWKDEKLIIQDGGKRTRVYETETHRLYQNCWKEEHGRGRLQAEESLRQIEEIRALPYEHLIFFHSGSDSLRTILDTGMHTDSLEISWAFSGLSDPSVEGFWRASQSWQMEVRGEWVVWVGSESRLSPVGIFPSQRLSRPSGAKISVSWHPPRLIPESSI